jgi:hypothetical protein
LVRDASPLEVAISERASESTVLKALARRRGYCARPL